MTSTKLVVVFALGFLLAGCANIAPMGPMVCEKVKEKACKDKGKSPVVKVSKKFWSNKLKFSPECITAEPGTVIVMEIDLKDNAPGSAKLAPENAANAWLKGENSDNAGYIFIPVPNVEKKDYKYNVEANGMCSDPRVRVK